MDRNIDKRVEEVVNVIMGDYKKKISINKGNLIGQPDRECIISIIKNLQHIIFPGYFNHKHLKSYHREYQLSALVEDIIYQLSKQIGIALRYDEKYEGLEFEKMEEVSHNLSVDFMSTIPRIREYLETDVEAAYEGDPAAFSKDEIILSYPGIFAIMVNRIAHELYLLKIPLIPRIMTEYAHNLTGIDIHPGARIGKHFFIDHGTGIVIGETTEIGERVKIYQGVTLGAMSTRGGQSLKSVKRHPTIEDEVTIYSGASILGGNTVIGREVIIGSNAFITKSVPQGMRVSAKNPELQYMITGDEQTDFFDYVI